MLHAALAIAREDHAQVLRAALTVEREHVFALARLALAHEEDPAAVDIGGGGGGGGGSATDSGGGGGNVALQDEARGIGPSQCAVEPRIVRQARIGFTKLIKACNIYRSHMTCT